MDQGLGDDSAAFSVPLRAKHLPAWPGRTLHLGNVWASQNFYHWLIDAVGKAAVFQRAGFKWSDVDRVFLPALDTSATRRLVQALAIPEELQVSLGQNEQVECEELWLPSMPAPARFAPAWLVSWLRDLAPVVPEQTGRRIFFERRGRRAPANVGELGALMKSYGFETVDPADFNNVVIALAGADYVVGVHGAGLTNVIWTQPGARFLEIIPDSHAWPFYRALAVGAGVDYGALVVSRQPEGRGHLDWGNNNLFHVPLDELARMLDRMIGSHS
jgi:capsular polysaccharide biosynthesis protein